MSYDIDQLELSELGRAPARSHAESLLKSTLDMLPMAIVLVDEGARIVHHNTAAEAMLRAGEPIVSSQGQLRATCKVAGVRLMAATGRATSRARPCVASISVPLPYRDGGAAIAYVRPLTFEPARPGQTSGAAAAVFIAESKDHAAPPLDALTALFDLTPSEARVLGHIASGRNRRETAAALGVADTTVKTHLGRIYSKTGALDRLGLCRLVSALSSPALPVVSGG